MLAAGEGSGKPAIPADEILAEAERPSPFLAASCHKEMPTRRAETGVHNWLLELSRELFENTARCCIAEDLLSSKGLGLDEGLDRDL